MVGIWFGFNWSVSVASFGLWSDSASHRSVSGSCDRCGNRPRVHWDHNATSLFEQKEMEGH